MSEAPPMILQKSLAGSASPSPNPTPIITIRQSETFIIKFYLLDEILILFIHQHHQ